MKRIVLAGILLTMVFAASTAFGRYLVGDHVSDFTLTDADGNIVNLYDYQSLVIFINIWQST
jgi:hypothetical protein